MQASPHAPVNCPSCGKQFAWKPELAGRQAKCRCGVIIRIPAEPATEGSIADGDAPDDLYGLAPEAGAAKKPARATSAPWVVGSVVVERETEDGQVVREANPFDAAASESASAAPPVRRKRVDEDDETPASDPTEPSIFLDWILPIGLIALGLFLSFLEVTKYSEKPVSAGTAAITAIAVKVALAAGLMLGGMYLATVAGEIDFVGALGVVALKLVSIAIGAGAIYGVVTHAVGGMEGAAAGSFAAIATYAVLFKVVMRLDAKETAICTMITWILVAAANYAAWRLDGMMREAWV